MRLSKSIIIDYFACISAALWFHPNALSTSLMLEQFYFINKSICLISHHDREWATLDMNIINTNVDQV